MKKRHKQIKQISSSFSILLYSLKYYKNIIFMNITTLNYLETEKGMISSQKCYLEREWFDFEIFMNIICINIILH